MNDAGSSDHARQPDLALDVLRPMATHSDSEIMYLVSPDYDILMLNAGFEAVWQRPATGFLGKKCYREIEKRQEPCPHCPGVVALQTGTMSEAESYAVLDDGTRIPFLLRAYPLYGANGEPAGFVETAEDISERRRFEDDARYEAGLVNDLLATSSTSRVLRLGLDAALRLEGVESGGVFAVDHASGRRELVAERGLSPEVIELYSSQGASPPSTGSPVAESGEAPADGAPFLVRVPVVCGSEPVAELAATLSGDPHLWLTSRSRLEALASMLASALVRIKAERLRGDAAVNAQTLIAALPLAAFVLDDRGKVTIWNEQAERVFGWSGLDVLGQTPPFIPEGDGDRFLGLVSEATGASGSPGFESRCLFREGGGRDISFRATPIRDLLGDGSSYLVVAAAGEFGVPATGDPGSDARKPSSADPPSGPALTSEVAGPQLREGAQVLGRFLQRLSRSLGAGEGGDEGPVPADPGTYADPASAKMSISWTDNGELDVRLRLPAAGPETPGEAVPVRALVIQSDQENGGRLGRILEDLGYPAVVCASVPDALELLRTRGNGDGLLEVAIVDMVMPGGPDAVQAAKLLTTADPGLRVVVSSDHGIAGHKAHGFAAALGRPYTDENVRSALVEALVVRRDGNYAPAATKGDA